MPTETRRQRSPRPLAAGHRHNPWMRAPASGDALIAATSAARAALGALLVVAREVGLRGICQCCGCTELSRCSAGCRWVDDQQTGCTTCQARRRGR